MKHVTQTQQHQEDAYSFPYHYLDLKAEEYRLILHVEYLSRLNTVKNLLKPLNGQMILDAGCGDGRFAYELGNENVKVVGVDFSMRALAFARVFNPTVEFHALNLKELSLPYRFDAIVLIETLEHFIPEDIPAVLKSLADLLGPGGKLIVTVPSVNIPLIEKHYQHFSEESLRRTLQSHFKVTQCFGHSKIRGGVGTKLYWSLRRVATWLYPFRHHFNGVRRLLECFNEYYEAHFALGKPHECSGLIAVCERL